MMYFAVAVSGSRKLGEGLNIKGYLSSALIAPRTLTILSFVLFVVKSEILY